MKSSERSKGRGARTAMLWRPTAKKDGQMKQNPAAYLWSASPIVRRAAAPATARSVLGEEHRNGILRVSDGYLLKQSQRPRIATQFSQCSGYHAIRSNVAASTGAKMTREAKRADDSARGAKRKTLGLFGVDRNSDREG